MAHHKVLSTEDSAITAHNTRVQRAETTLEKASARASAAQASLATDLPPAKRQKYMKELETAKKQSEKASGSLKGAVTAADSLQGTGSGKVKVYIPTSTSH